jgi:hypothetical protein
MYAGKRRGAKCGVPERKKWQKEGDMNNLLIILGVGLLSAVLPFGKAMAWGSSFSPASFSTIAATSDSGGGGASWSSPASYGWEAGDGGAWSRVSDIQSAASIIDSSTRDSVYSVSFLDTYGSFGRTSVFRTQDIDLGDVEGVGRVTQKLTLEDVTFTTPAFYFGAATIREHENTVIKETTTTTMSQLMTPTGSSIADTSTGSKLLVKLSGESVIPEKSGTAFQDKLDSLLTGEGEKFMVFGKEGDPVKASGLSDNLGSINFKEKMLAAVTSSERPVQLSLGDVLGANLRTYTLDKKTDVDKEVLSSTFRSESDVAHEQFVPSSQYTRTFFAGVSYDITPEETPVPSAPDSPSSSGSSGHSSSGTKPIKVRVTDNEGRPRQTYSLDESEVKKNSDGSIAVSSDNLPSVGNVEVVDTNTGESYHVLAGTPEQRTKWTDDYSKSLGGKSGGGGKEGSGSQASGDASSGAPSKDNGSVSSGKNGGGWGSFSTGDDEKDRKLAVGKYGK